MLAKIKGWLKGLGSDEAPEFVKELRGERIYHLKSLAEYAGKR